MKTKIIYLLLVFMSFTLALPAQTKDRISIELKGETLPTALKKLEQVSGYRILFTYSDVQSYRVTASIHDNSITQAVEKILEDKPLTYVRKGEEYIIILSKTVQKTPVAIRGMVVDEKQQPMPYCNVLLLTADSVFVNGCVTKEDGTFLMTGEAEAPYLLKVSYIGYATALQTVEPTNLVQLLPDTQTLKEVTVTANRPLIESLANGLKANVAGTSLARMGTANEMLTHLPFVTSKTSTLSLNASYKWLFANIQYFRPKNSIANITMPYNEETHPGVLLFGAANLATYNGFAFNLTASPKIGMWQPQFSVSAMLSAADGRNLGIDVYRKQPLFNFGWDNNFNLPHGWFLNLQANMNTAARMGFAVIRVEGRVNARVSKSFLKEDALTLSLTANDILRTGYYHSIVR